MANSPLKRNKNAQIGKIKSVESKISKRNKNKIFEKLLPLPWDLWPVEARLIIGLLTFWSIAGLFILGSASWWVANREMGDGAYYIKRQLIWLTASWSIFYLAININLTFLSAIEKVLIILFTRYVL